MDWKMKCLLCGHTDTYLVRIQEHVIQEHGYTQPDLQRQTKREVDGPGHYIYTFLDGKDWLEAERLGGNFLGGL